MRSLVILGVVATFIACAFVPPSDANILARAEEAKIIVAERTKTALLAAGMPSTDQLKKAAALVRSLSSDPNVTALLIKGAKGVKPEDYVSTLKQTADALTSMAPAKKTVTKMVSRAVTAVVGIKPSKQWVTIVTSERDSALKTQLERLDFAALKGDARLCKELTSIGLPHKTSSPTIGDLIALCLAKVTRDAARCDQIDSSISLPLKAICEEELALNT